VENLLLDDGGDTLTIWFNRPENRNALSSGGHGGARGGARGAAGKPYRFVVLRGRGGVFCAGGDLKMFRHVFQDGMPREQIVAFNAEFGRIMAAIRALPQLFLALPSRGRRWPAAWVSPASRTW
jgi:isohexenylglutaconyl-CoA hydratase